MAKFTKRYIFNSSDSKTLKEIILQVPKGTKEVLVKGYYKPKSENNLNRNRELILSAVNKYLDGYKDNYNCNEDYFIGKYSPINNFVSYSLFDTHGQMRAQVINFSTRTVQISKDLVSLGCIPGEIYPGEWKLFLELHEVVTNNLNVYLEVQFNKKITSGIASTKACLAEKRHLKQLNLKQNKRSGSRWYSGDLHVHSHHSDGNNSIGELMEYFKHKGYDFFVLTDHNTTSGWNEELNDHMLVIPGCEITTFYGHMVAINRASYVDWYSLDQKSTFEELSKILHSQNSLLSITHSAAIDNPICTGCRWEYKNFDWTLADCMEVLICPSNERKVESQETLKKWERLLNIGLRVVAVSDTDLHDIKLQKEDSPRTYVWSNSYTKEDILTSLREGKVYLSCGFDIDFYLKSSQNGKKFYIGDEININKELNIIIHFQIKRLKGEVRIEVVKQGQVIQTFYSNSGEISKQYLDKVNGDCWYNLRVFKKDNLIGLTNPIYIKLDNGKRKLHLEL